MRSIKQCCAGIVLAAAVVGCATGPKYAEVKSSIPALATDKGRIYFYRSNSMFGAAIQPAVMLNSQEVGNSKPGGFFYVDRPSGDYEVVLATEVDKKLTFTLATGEERFVRMSIGLGVVVGRVIPELVDRATGMTEIADLSYIGPYIGTPAAK